MKAVWVIAPLAVRGNASVFCPSRNHYNIKIRVVNPYLSFFLIFLKKLLTFFVKLRIMKEQHITNIFLLKGYIPLVGLYPNRVYKNPFGFFVNMLQAMTVYLTVPFS